MEKCAMSTPRRPVNKGIEQEVYKRAKAHKEMCGEWPDEWGMEALRREVKRDAAIALEHRGYRVGPHAVRNPMTLDSCEWCGKPVHEVGEDFCCTSCADNYAQSIGYEDADEMYDELAAGAAETERAYDPYRAVDNPSDDWEALDRSYWAYQERMNERYKKLMALGIPEYLHDEIDFYMSEGANEEQAIKRLLAAMEKAGIPRSSSAKTNRGRPLRSANKTGMFSKTKKQLEATARRGGKNATAAKRELARRAKKRGK